MTKTTLFLVLGAATLILMLSWPSYATSSIKKDAEQLSKTNLRDDSLDRFLATLAFSYECTRACAAAAHAHAPYKRLDSNGRYSYGCLQFQFATYRSFARRYGIDPSGDGGIYSCENQLRVARAMFLEDAKRASNHWATSIYTRGLGMPSF